jgi:hypothetical protein
VARFQVDCRDDVSPKVGRFLQHPGQFAITSQRGSHADLDSHVIKSMSHQLDCVAQVAVVADHQDTIDPFAPYIVEHMDGEIYI